jgi:hypothetical protein
MLKLSKEKLVSPWYWVLFAAINLAVLGFLFWTQWSVFRQGNMYGMIDQIFPELNPGMNVYRNWFVWDDTRALGETQYLYLPNLFEQFYVYLLSLIFASETVVNFLKIFLLQIGYYLGNWLVIFTLYKFVLKQKVTGKGLALVSFFAALGLLNLHFFQSSHAFLFNQRYNFFVFGLLFYAINSLIYTRRGYGLFIVASLLSIASWAFLGFWVILFLFLFAYLLVVSWNWKRTFRLLGLHLLLIAPALVSLVMFYGSVDRRNNTAVQYKDVIFTYANQNSDLLHIFSFVGGANWGQAWGWVNQLVYPYSALYQSQVWFVLVSWLLLILFISSLVHWRIKSPVRWFLGLSAVACIFLAASYHPPLGGIFQVLIDRVPFFILFRESHNKVYFLLISLILQWLFLWYFALRPHSRKLLLGALAVYQLIFLSVGLKYNIYSPQGVFQFPIQTYRRLEQVIPPYSRVMWLPEYAYAKRYDYGYTGNTITRFIFPYQQFDISQLLEASFANPKIKDLLNNFNYNMYDKGLYNFGSEEPSFAPELLAEAGVNYVVFDKQLAGDTTPLEFNKQDEYLSKLEALSAGSWDGYYKVYEDERFVVYGSGQPWLSLQSPNMVYQQVSPVEYHVLITRLPEGGQQDLTLLQLFNSGWKVYPQVYDPYIKCPGSRQAVVQLTDAGYIPVDLYQECGRDKQVFTATGFQALWRKSLPENSHGMTNGYANNWTVDADYIMENYPKEYYRQNPDGSINLELVVYFRPQSYWVIGWLISGLTVLGAVGWLIYRRRKGGQHA